MGKSKERKQERRQIAAPALIVSMSLQLTIPGRVALQQSSLALRQMGPSSYIGHPFDDKTSANGNPVLGSCLTSGVSFKEACPTFAAPIRYRICEMRYLIWITGSRRAGDAVGRLRGTEKVHGERCPRP